MQRWKSAASLALLPLLAGCLGQTPERALILEAHVAGEGAARQLEVTQQLRFSTKMRDALEHGIPLRLTYRIEACDVTLYRNIGLQYSPLNRHFELHRPGETQARTFTRSGALLAALDRVRLPIGDSFAPGCSGRVVVGLDLTSLPTPLRFPAFLQPSDWRMVSPPAAWSTSPPRA
jgi:hypothetical protein